MVAVPDEYRALFEVKEMVRAAAEVVRPPPELLPSEWSERYITLSPAETESPGPWSNDYFPFLAPIMDTCAEAVEKGKKGVVFMKPAQVGGSRAMQNVWGWMHIYLPGPQLYLISTGELAREFGRDRFGPMIDTTPPIARDALRGKAHGELTHIKRFRRGKWAILTYGSLSTLESQPFRKAFVDEAEGMRALGIGDPLGDVDARTKAYKGSTFRAAFAHPTTPDGPVGELYYQESDQRRAFVRCPHCPGEFWLSWDGDPRARGDRRPQATVVRVFPEGDETLEAAKRNPARYRMVAPCCGSEITDAERYAISKHTEQRSTLPPEEAEKKEWIGVHISHLYTTKPLSVLAREFIRTFHPRPNERRAATWQNKTLGDVHRVRLKQTTSKAWRACIVTPRRAEDHEAYLMGQVPPWVQFVTSGQDSGERWLHWGVWGFGLLRDQDQYEHLVAALIEPGEFTRTPPREDLETADLKMFNGLLYDRIFPRTDGGEGLQVVRGFHDSGWQGAQGGRPVYVYCLDRLGRAFPSKGLALDEETAPRHKPVKFSEPLEWVVNGRRRQFPLKRADMNTYTLKADLLAMVGRRFLRPGELPQPEIVLPADVPDDVIEQLSSEYLTRNKKGRLEWAARGENHHFDCAVMAFGAALTVNPFMRGATRAEQVEQQKDAARRSQARRVEERDRDGRRTIRRDY